MNKENIKGQETERVLRRSQRNRKPVLSEGSNSDTEVVESETETESIGRSKVSSEAYYKGDRAGYVFEGGRYKLNRKEEMFSEKEHAEGPERKRATISSGAGVGSLPEPTMNDFIKFYVEDQRKKDVEAQRRLELERGERRAEAERNLSNQQKLLETMLARAKVADTPPPPPTVRLPTLQEGGDVEAFINNFETMLKIAEIPKRLWKRELVTHIPMDAVSRVGDVAGESGSSYEEVLDALRGSVALSFGSAAEDFFSGEKGSVYELEIRSSLLAGAQLLQL